MTNWVEVMGFEEIDYIEDTSSKQGWYFNIMTTEGITVAQMEIYLKKSGYIYFVYEDEEYRITICPINKKSIFPTLKKMMSTITFLLKIYDIILPQIVPPPAELEIPNK